MLYVPPLGSLKENERSSEGAKTSTPALYKIQAPSF